MLARAIAVLTLIAYHALAFVQLVQRHPFHISQQRRRMFNIRSVLAEMSYREMQAECKLLGVAASGNKVY